jgi:hypothetical protein
LTINPHFSPPRLLRPYLPEILCNTSSPLLGGLSPACGMRLRAFPQSFSAASPHFSPLRLLRPHLPAISRLSSSLTRSRCRDSAPSLAAGALAK